MRVRLRVCVTGVCIVHELEDGQQMIHGKVLMMDQRWMGLQRTQNGQVTAQ